MKKANLCNANEGGEGMTDRQFVHHLKEMLAVAEHSENLEEFIKELKKMIASYGE